MKAEKFAVVTEIVSSVAIIVTLIYLTIEIRQNTEALNAQSRQSVLASAQTELFMLVQNPELVLNVIKQGPLTREENAQIDAYLTAVFRAREFAWLQFRNGLIDGPQWDTELAVNQSLLSSPRVRYWWQKVGRTYVSMEFAQFLDTVISGVPASRDDWQSQATWSNP